MKGSEAGFSCSKDYIANKKAMYLFYGFRFRISVLR